MNTEFPRRIQLELMTPEELAIFNLVGEIEKLGAHPLLTDVVVLLGDARSKLADWVDLQAAERNVEQTELYSCTHDAYESIIKNGHCDRCGKPIRRKEMNGR